MELAVLLSFGGNDYWTFALQIVRCIGGRAAAADLGATISILCSANDILLLPGAGWALSSMSLQTVPLAVIILIN